MGPITFTLVGTFILVKIIGSIVTIYWQRRQTKAIEDIAFHTQSIALWQERY